MTSPGLVGTSSNKLAVDYPQQRKGFFANELYWIFYSTGSLLVYKTSSDGVSWNSATTISTGVSTGYVFSIWFDGTYMHYVKQLGNSLYYRRGTPDGDGAITWSAAEQTVITIAGTNEFYPFVSVDTNGYPWVSYTEPTYGNPTSSMPYVTKSSTNDGTWVTDDDFPYQLSAVEKFFCTSILPMSDGKMYAIYTSSAPEKVSGKLWNASWYSEEIASLQQSFGTMSFSAVIDDSDDVHLVYTTGDSPQGYLKYHKRVFASGWEGSETTLQTSHVDLFFPYPTISIDPLSNLCVFWRRDTTIIHYKRRIGGSWDASPTTINTEAVGGLDNKRMSSFYESPESVSLAFSTGTASPYNIWFNLSEEPPSAVAHSQGCIIG